MHKYDEAIKDCLKAIEIDPNYGKAYSRLGLAYYAQGKYSDAINKGFRKGRCVVFLYLDTHNLMAEKLYTFSFRDSTVFSTELSNLLKIRKPFSLDSFLKEVPLRITLA